MLFIFYFCVCAGFSQPHPIKSTKTLKSGECATSVQFGLFLTIPELDPTKQDVKN